MKSEAVLENPIAEHHALMGLMIGAVIISFSSVFVKLAQVAPTVSGFYRVTFGALFLVIAALFQGLTWRATGRVYGLLVLCGLFFALDLYFWHISIHFVGPGLSTILSNFQVIFLGFVGVVFLGEPMGRRLVGAVPLAMIGLTMVVGLEWNRLEALYQKGIGYGLATALCYAAYLLTLKNAQSLKASLTPLSGLAVVSLVAALFLGLQVWVEGQSFAIPDKKSLAALVALGLGSQTLGWMLITRSLPHIRASLVGLCLMMQPALAFVWDMLIFKRSTTAINIAGVVLTLVAIYLGSTRSAAPKTRDL